MCGIFAIISKKKHKLLTILNSLKKLEYRGYDSSGISFLKDNSIETIRSKGPICNLEEKCNLELETKLAICHTRWATHGIPNESNAHPHISNNGNIIIVHNGVLENYESIKKILLENKYSFNSETDTEIIANFIQYFNDQNPKNEFLENLKGALDLMVGTFGLVLINKEKNILICVSKSSPIVIGIENETYYISSDYYSFLSHTKNVITLKDNQIAVISNDNLFIKDLSNNLKTYDPIIEKIDVNLNNLEKEYFDHFMLKEIYQQGKSINNCIRGRVTLSEKIILGGLEKYIDNIKYIDIIAKSKKIIFIGCGTSLHAAMIGKYIIEELAEISVEYEQASEFRYRKFIKQNDSVYIFLSQSGETSDTIEALKMVKKYNIPIIGICNVVGSQISRLTDAGIYLHVGPEIGVASTKAFTGQLCVLYMLAIKLAEIKKINLDLAEKIKNNLLEIPNYYSNIIDNYSDFIKEKSKVFKFCSNFLFLGRGYNYPIALEGSLKLKEISYIHAEGYSASEMKHGPIALVDNQMPVVFIAIQDELFSKIKTNINEIKSRKGTLIIITNENVNEFDSISDFVIKLPKIQNQLYPFLTILPLQLMSYYIAIEKDCNVDRPRNLAKCVTVE